MTNTNDIEKNEKPHRNVNQPQGHIEIRTNYNEPAEDIDVVIADVSTNWKL